jgi:hypothetical protein
MDVVSCGYSVSFDPHSFFLHIVYLIVAPQEIIPKEPFFACFVGF